VRVRDPVKRMSALTSSLWLCKKDTETKRENWFWGGEVWVRVCVFFSLSLRTFLFVTKGVYMFKSVFAVLLPNAVYPLYFRRPFRSQNVAALCPQHMSTLPSQPIEVTCSITIPTLSIQTNVCFFWRCGFLSFSQTRENESTGGSYW